MAAMTLAGCAGQSEMDTPPGRPTQLAATPEPLRPEEQETPSPTPSPTSSPSPDPAAFRSRAKVADAKGDAGLQAPDYADLVSLAIESNGRDARITVDVAANLSATLADGEVMGIGVDLYRTVDAKESDYQLFADGGSDGWFAYLQTPQGFVKFPGEFRLGGGRLVFEVPLESIGGLTATATSTFLDWSRARTLINEAESDRAPDSGRVQIGL